LDSRKKVVRENGIINLLFCLLHLCHFMIYGENRESDDGTDLVIQDKSPQKIAKAKLDAPSSSDSSKRNNSAIKEIYSILLLCIQGNAESSNYLM
jgi:hypothetical protein